MSKTSVEIDRDIARKAAEILAAQGQHRAPSLVDALASA